MHIVLISPAWPIGYPNGIVTYVHNLRIGLRDAGHRVSVVALAGTPDTLDDVHLIRAGWRTRIKSILSRFFRNGFGAHERIAASIADSILRIHSRNMVDLVEMEESFGWCGDIQKYLPLPVVVKLHGPAFLTLVEEEAALPDSRLKIASECKALQNSPFVVSPSRNTLSYVQQHAQLPPTWGRVIVNPLVLDENLPRWSASSSNSNTLLFVGRFDKLKGGDLVIRALAKLLETRPWIQLVFAGPDRGIALDDGRTVFLAEFARSVLQESQMGQLQFLGVVSPARVAQLRAEAAITLVCSRFDNQPNTVLEAFFQGCPVVAIESGGVAEVVEHQVTGLLSKPNDVEDFCIQVAWMLDHPTEAQAMAEQGWQYVRRVHDVRHVAAQTISNYKDACRLYAQGVG